MRFLLIALTLSLPFACRDAGSAASPVENYLASRDAYMKQFADSDIIDDAQARTAHERALDDLQTQLRRIIGPSALKGFSTKGKINLDSLSTGFIGTGQLDALRYSSPDDKIWGRVNKESEQGREDGDRAYRRCFAAHAKLESAFPALVKRAQGLIDALPKK